MKIILLYFTAFKIVIAAKLHGGTIHLRHGCGVYSVQVKPSTIQNADTCMPRFGTKHFVQ